MKRSEIKVGGIYVARISGNFVTVRVDAIRDSDLGQCSPKLSYVSGGRRDRRVIYYDVTNLTTGRKTTFRSAAKFRSNAPTKHETETIREAARKAVHDELRHASGVLS